ncbi:hypothetical protein XarbCFBP8152_08100 [Xanthomonas arboricola]|nr:hypothetical protein XarbCFBP8152_08100 [Xanthomonas arboricola]
MKSAEFSKAAPRAGGREPPLVPGAGRLHERIRPARARQRVVPSSWKGLQPVTCAVWMQAKARAVCRDGSV